MDSLQLHQQLEKRMLQVDYSSYQEVDKQILPQNIRIIAVDDTDQVAITMEFKSVSLNKEVRFPFKIPTGFKEIIIKLHSTICLFFRSGRAGSSARSKVQ